jgi:hypothetical protein
MEIVNVKGYCSVAFPILGSGSGNRSQKKALAFMREAFEAVSSQASARIVRLKEPDRL